MVVTKRGRNFLNTVAYEDDLRHLEKWDEWAQCLQLIQQSVYKRWKRIEWERVDGLNQENVNNPHNQLPLLFYILEHTYNILDILYIII